MKKSKNYVGIVAAVFVIAMIALVWYLLFGADFIRRAQKSDGQEEKQEETTEKEELLNISNVDQAYDAILNKSTKEFIGNHPIDEEFLSWFTGNYGIEQLEKIASYAQLDDGEVWYEITGNSIHVLWYDYCMETGIQQYAYDKTYVKECQDADRIVLDFTGDFSLAEGVGTTDYYHSVGDDITKCLGADLRQEMLNADIMTINNEFVYSTRGQALAGKAYTFRGDPKTCQNLVLLGVDVAGLANNHVYDFGENAFLDTLDTLKAQNIPYIGAGRNLEEASEPIFFIANGKKIAIVAATQIERSTKYTKEATEDSPGVLKTLDSAKYVAQIAKAKQNADYVICYVHWGTEHTHQYGSDQVKLAKDFVAAGADAIIGAHPHCLQGADIMDGVPVFYSLGNFYFSQEAEMPDDYDTAMAQIIIDDSGTLSARLLPCHFSGGNLELVSDPEKYRQILADVEGYSDQIAFDGDGYLLVH